MFDTEETMLQRFMRTSPVTFALIVMVTVMFIITTALYGFSPTPQELLDIGGLHTFYVHYENEYWRFVTVMFLHSGFIHFLFNTLFGLYIISSALERMIGSLKFAIIYFVSGIGASLITYVWEFNFVNPPWPVGVGASGAIFGVLGVLFFLTIYKASWFSPQDISSIRSIILINVVFTLLSPQISTTAHFGGLVSGFAIAAVLGLKRAHRGAKKGFGDPYDPYQHEKDFESDDPFDYIEIVDDDEDDDDRRVW